MTLRIIAEQEIHRKTLEKALLTLNQNVRVYADEVDIENDQDGLRLYVLSEDNTDSAIKHSQNEPVFAIGDREIVDHDFVTLFQKPVRLGSLAQSIASYLRHKEQQHSLSPVTMGIYTLDPRINQLKHNKKSNVVKLTEKEQDILLYLYDQRQKPVSRQDLLDSVWGYAENVETHTLETHIYRLRQKIEADPTQPGFLMTNDEGYFLKLD